MRYTDLTEAGENFSLISKLNRSIERSIERFVEFQTKQWRAEAICDRRKQLGYHPYNNNAAGYKPFDQAEFDAANRDWSTDSVWIGDRLDDFLPDPEKSSHHPVYALMGNVSKEATSIVQDHVRSKFGDPVKLANGTIERDVKQIRVSIWWRVRDDGGKPYLGIYRANSYHANGNETLLEVIVDRKAWASLLRQEISSLLGREGADFSEFTHQIVNVLIHEYAHLEQDIKGKTGSLGLIPGKKGRNTGGYTNTTSGYEEYLGKTAEIDAHATGASAEVINQIINKFARYAARWNRDWKPEDINNDEWNDSVKDAIAGVAYGEIPRGEYRKYIEGLDRRFKELDPTIKDKFLKKVKQRFIRGYVNRLRKYLRQEEPGKMAKPAGTLPSE